MHSSLLKSQHYHNTPAATCLGPYWPVTREHTLVPKQVLTFSACNRAVVNFSVATIYVYRRTSCALKTVIGAACCSGFRDTKVPHLAKPREDHLIKSRDERLITYKISASFKRSFRFCLMGAAQFCFYFQIAAGRGACPQLFSTRTRIHTRYWGRKRQYVTCSFPVWNVKNKFTKSTYEKHSFTNGRPMYCTCMYVWSDMHRLSC